MADGDNTNLPLPNLPLGQAVINATSPDQQQAQQAEQGSTQGAATQPAAKAPKMGGQPLLYRYISEMIKGQAGGQPISRGDASLNFLGEFLGNLSQGLASAGHGPGANLRGAAGAIQAPYQRSLQDFQVQQQANQQQAQLQGEQARTQLAQAQAGQMQNQIQTPYGQMSQAAWQQLLQKIAPAQIAGGARVSAAQTRAEGAENVQRISNAGKMDQKELELQIMGKQISKLVPAKRPDGTVGMEALNKLGAPMGFVEGALPSSQYLGKVTTTQDIKQNAEGGYDFIPKTTVTSPNIPGAAGGGAAGGGGARPVMMAGGGGEMSAPASAQARSRAAAADSVNQIIPRIREIVAQHSDELGPIAGRFEKGAFKVGKASGPWVNELNGLLTSLYSFAGTMHGWRALQVEEKFKQEYGGLEQDPKNFMGSLDAMEHTANATIKSGTTRIGGGGTVQYRLGDKVYNIPAAQEKEFLKDKPAATKVPGASR